MSTKLPLTLKLSAAAFAALMAFALAQLVTNFAGVHWLPISVIAAFSASVAIQVAFEKLETDLSRRMRVPSPVWSVQLNGVNVGTVTDAEYAVMQFKAYGSCRNVVGQVMNFGFRNVYQADIGGRLRQHCNCPADGVVALVTSRAEA